MSPERLADPVVPTGRLGRALLHLADRLPDVFVSFELAQRSLALHFDDNEDSLPSCADRETWRAACALSASRPPPTSSQTSTCG